LVFNLTPFYPEGGGQVGDKGLFRIRAMEIFFTFLIQEKKIILIVHQTKTIPDVLEGNFTAVVDPKQRKRTSSNHTATHLMHQALRSVLGIM